MNFLLSYLLFLFKSTNEHDVHSPFVYKLVTECFYKKNPIQKLHTVNLFRKDLLSNKKVIHVTDFGAGSKIFKSNQRKVSQIAKHAGISRKRSALLFKIVAYFQPKNILEVGTSLGLGTSALALGNLEASVTTLEGCPETANIAKNQFEKYGLKNISLVVGDFKNTFKDEINKKKYDLIYFDGNHTKEATLNYFALSLNSIHNDSVLIFDDIHWSKEMEEAWEEIKNHKEVKVTIDTFYWGLAFFRKEQVKEHFRIRV